MLVIVRYGTQPEPTNLAVSTGFEPVVSAVTGQNLLLADPDTWSGRWDSNPQPSRWQREALPLSYPRT